MASSLVAGTRIPDESPRSAAPADTVPGVADRALEVHAFAFTGRTAEYFRIWLVSLALSLLTLGVYSAWGKVRKKRYLYDHTRLAGTGFEFRGSPWAILRGRVLAVLLFGGMALGGHVLVELQLGLAALLVLLTPWIVVASARFNARNTFYRNIGFDFDAGVGAAAKVFLGFGAVALMTGGLAYPWFRARRARFMMNGHRFGATRFDAQVGASAFALVYFLALLAAIACGVVLAGALAIPLIGARRHAPANFDAVLAAALPPFYACYIAIFAFVRARTLNLVANGTVLGPLYFRSTLRAPRLAWLYVSNVIAVIATMGLATPWAVIRVTRYRAETLAVLAKAPLASLVAAPKASARATGSEISDLFDVDVAL